MRCIRCRGPMRVSAAQQVRAAAGVCRAEYSIWVIDWQGLITMRKLLFQLRSAATATPTPYAFTLSCAQLNQFINALTSSVSTVGPHHTRSPAGASR